jgi:dihydroxyacetone kinase
LVHKISGALAAQGRSLAEVAKVARLTAENLVSVGASLEHVHVPGRVVADEDQHLKIGEVEIGMGIHNEPGSSKEKVELPALVGKMLKQMLDQSDEDRAFLNVNSNEVVLLVNNLGGVSVLEMGGITAEVAAQLEKSYGIRPVRILSGTYMTSLNGLGFSITLLNVVNTDIGGPSMIELLDAPCEATGWSSPISKLTWEAKNEATREDKGAINDEIKPSGLKTDGKSAQETLTLALQNVIAVEPDVTRFDTVVGDGDCGIGLKRGAEGTYPLTPSYSSLLMLTHSSNPQVPLLKASHRRRRSGRGQHRPRRREDNGRHIWRPLRHLPQLPGRLPPQPRSRRSKRQDLGRSPEAELRRPVQVHTGPSRRPDAHRCSVSLRRGAGTDR